MSALTDLYRKIPAMKCKAGCTDCCGPVPSSAAERRVAPKLLALDEAVHVAVSGGCLDCAYAIAGSCAIYENRPFMCRLFGTAPEDELLRCPHGCAPDEPLTAQQAARLTGEYVRLMQEEQSRG